MTDRRITIDYTEYSSPEEMEPQDRELVDAALRLVDGTVVLGANQENVAYPSGLCA